MLTIMDLAAVLVIYWNCDWAASRAMIPRDYIMPCIEVTETVKREKFGSDWNLYLEWWRANRDREYADRDRRLQQFENKNK